MHLLFMHSKGQGENEMNVALEQPDSSENLLENDVFCAKNLNPLELLGLLKIPVVFIRFDLFWDKPIPW
jgi:hypothetical protein